MHRCIGVMALLLAACGGSSGTTFSTTMNGANEAPNPITTSGTGTATFTYQTNVGVSYTLSASNLTTNVIAAHIHLGAVGVKGDIVVDLTPPGLGAISGSSSGTFSAPKSTAKNLDGTTMTFGDLITAMQAGQTYVNVHTTQNPGGEIRGQLAKQ